MLEPRGNLRLPPQALKETPAVELSGPIEIAFDLPKAGYVTIAIDDDAGNRVRRLGPALLRNFPRKPVAIG